MGQAGRDVDGGGSVEGDGLAADVELYLRAEHLGVFRVGAPVEHDLVVVMDVLVDVGVRVRDPVDPAELDVVVGAGDLSVAHDGHGGTLAVLDALAGLVERRPGDVVLFFEISHEQGTSRGRLSFRP